MKTLGIVGTAKNTGKTTSALHLLDLVDHAQIHTALTSIGYDGENTDHVTGLPKPRYYARPGLTIATADSCLSLGTAHFINRISTGIRTILGEIIIATVAEPGFVVLAGPNRRVDLEKLLVHFQERGIELTMVDGALNRLAAMVLANGMVLSTGAAFDERIEFLVDHAAAMESLFYYPDCQNDCVSDIQTVCSMDNKGRIIQKLAVGSVTDTSSMLEVAKWLQVPSVERITIPGVFYPGLFQSMLESHSEGLPGKQIVFSSPLNLLATGSPMIWQNCIQRMIAIGVDFLYRSPMLLHFMTVNPFYPKYLQKTGNYIPEFVDKVELLRSSRAKINRTLVIDILQPPHPDLLAQCGL